MSLINDAFRRAKQVQERAPVLPSPTPLNPVEHTPHGLHGVGVILPVAITVVALLGLFLVWQLYQRNNATTSDQAMVNAAPPRRTGASVEPESGVNAAQPGRPALSASANPNLTTAIPSGPGAPRVAAAPGAATLTSPSSSSDGPAGLAPSTNAVATTPDVVGTNGAVAAQPEPPKPPPLTLQGIVFNPRRPSVVINGKTLFIGERIGQFRVAAIRPDSATLIGAGRTNLLSLEQ